jgi:[protein-PII] uridylyltransferase
MQRDIPPPPHFDGALLRQELTALFRKHGENPEEARPAVVARLAALLAEAHELAHHRLLEDGRGRACAEGLSAFEDALVQLIFDYTVAHVYRATNPTDTERMAVVATGGYGRGQLAPGSDIDLLFLLPYKQTAWGESVVEYILYVLWDLGQKVGHATRSIEQCLRLAEADMTIRTSLLDARLVHGEESLFRSLEERFAQEVVRGTARAFIDAKLAERDQRHARTGNSRYRVEPNIKEGKGGLRDLHTLHWLSRYLYGADPAGCAFAAQVFTPEEYAIYRKCEAFLWTVRCHLHFHAGRAEERLTFDVQPVLAERLGYAGRAGQRPVERFMKHYFLIAKEVGDLTAILVGILEMEQLKATSSLGAMLGRLNWRTRVRLRDRTDFRIESDALAVSDDKVFERDRVNLLRVFTHAEKLGVNFHPGTVRLLRRSHRSIDDTLRADPEANRLFLELLTAPTGPEISLRRMNEAGVLGRFIPEFRAVISMMQFNMYHHYTVDEHLLRTVGELTAIEQGGVSGELPLSTEIVKSIQSRRALYVAALLHDIGKGREEDHSVLGARIARSLCPRLGLTAAETETVAWLVEHHLVMSNTAQSRDLADPKTVRDFADLVQSPERLKLLLLLTVADIRAVGPGTWNGWKGQLLRTLYWETEPLVAGGHSQLAQKDRIAGAEADLREALADFPTAQVDRFIARHYPDYWLKTDARRRAEHARLIAAAEARGEKLATGFTSDAFTAVTELTVWAPNHPRLLSLFAGACAAAGANIVGAHISTTRDGFALDTFLLQRQLGEDDDERRRAERITQLIRRLLAGSARLDDLLAKRRPAERRIEAFTVEPEVIIDNAISDKLTVIEVAGLDRPGLLHALTSTLSDLNLDIASAHITTFGEKAVDVFYVTDLTSKKIIDPARQKTIRSRLVQVLAPPSPPPRASARQPRRKTRLAKGGTASE